jgi:hypothetical protein
MIYKTNTKAHELRKEGLSKLRYVLQEIKAKRLKHNQRKIHCGTAHCVFGWLDMMEGTAKMPLKVIKKLDLGGYYTNLQNKAITVNGHKFRLQENTLEAWCRKYKLSDDPEHPIGEHIYIIYRASSTLRQQFKSLENLEVMILGEVQVVDYNPFDTEFQEKTGQQKNFEMLMEALSAKPTEVSETCSVPVYEEVCR